MLVSVVLNQSFEKSPRLSILLIHRSAKSNANSSNALSCTHAQSPCQPALLAIACRAEALQVHTRNSSSVSLPTSPSSIARLPHFLQRVAAHAAEDPLVWSQLATYLQFLRCTDPHSSRTLKSAHVLVYYTLGNGIPLAASARRREAARGPAPLSARVAPGGGGVAAGTCGSGCARSFGKLIMVKAAQSC